MTGPPNKGMKLTKPGQLRSFAAYPRCSADLRRGPRTRVVAVVVVAVAAAACKHPAPGGDESAQPPAAAATAPATVAGPKWYPMADSAVPLPAGCSARCSLDCDSWSGRIWCQGDAGSIEVWGGGDAIAGMRLDEKGATVDGEEQLSSGARLRWGTSADGQFCTAVGWRPPDAKPDDNFYWTWQLCARSGEARRDTLLTISRGHIKHTPKQELLRCENLGC